MALQKPVLESQTAAGRFIEVFDFILGNADNAQAFLIPRYSDKTVQIFGTFGGATVTIQGSNDPLVPADDVNGTTNATWATLTDPLGAALTATSAKLATILQNPLYIRAISSGGTGSAINVNFCAKRTY